MYRSPANCYRSLNAPSRYWLSLAWHTSHSPHSLANRPASPAYARPWIFRRWLVCTYSLPSAPSAPNARSSLTSRARRRAEGCEGWTNHLSGGVIECVIARRVSSRKFSGGTGECKPWRGGVAGKSRRPSVEQFLVFFHPRQGFAPPALSGFAHSHCGRNGDWGNGHRGVRECTGGHALGVLCDSGSV